MSLSSYGTIGAFTLFAMMEGCGAQQNVADQPYSSGLIGPEGISLEDISPDSEDAGSTDIVDQDSGAASDEYAATPDILDLVNKARAKGRMCGDTFMKAVPPVKWSDTLATTALNHARDEAGYDYYSHCGRKGNVKPGSGETGAYGKKCPEGTTRPGERANAAGYPTRFVGENIAIRLDDSMEGVMKAWLGSAGHCANIMNPDYTEIGVARALGWNTEHGFTESAGHGKARQWVMNLGNPNLKAAD